MGSSGCEGRLERPPSVEEIVITYDWSVRFEHQQDHQKYSTRSWQVSSTLIRVMVRLSGVAWNHLIEDTMQLWSTAHRNSALKYISLRKHKIEWKEMVKKMRRR